MAPSEVTCLPYDDERRLRGSAPGRDHARRVHLVDGRVQVRIEVQLVAHVIGRRDLAAGVDVDTCDMCMRMLHDIMCMCMHMHHDMCMHMNMTCAHAHAHVHVACVVLIQRAPSLSSAASAAVDDASAESTTIFMPGSTVNGLGSPDVRCRGRVEGACPLEGGSARRGDDERSHRSYERHGRRPHAYICSEYPHAVTVRVLPGCSKGTRNGVKTEPLQPPS